MSAFHLSDLETFLAISPWVSILVFVDMLLGVAFNGIWIASMDAKASDAKGSEVRRIPSERGKRFCLSAVIVRGRGTLLTSSCALDDFLDRWRIGSILTQSNGTERQKTSTYPQKKHCGSLREVSAKGSDGDSARYQWSADNNLVWQL